MARSAFLVDRFSFIILSKLRRLCTTVGTHILVPSPKGLASSVKALTVVVNGMVGPGAMDMTGCFRDELLLEV